MNSLDAIRDHIRSLLELKGDSMDVVQTVLFLEENFGVDFSVQPFSPDDFESIQSINELVIRQAWPGYNAHGALLLRYVLGVVRVIHQFRRPLHRFAER